MTVDLGTIGKLNAKVGADVADFKKGMKAAGGYVADLNKRFRDGVNDATRYALKMGAVGAAIGVALVAKTIDAIDQQAKLANRLRGTIEGLETTRRAADLAGIEFTQLQMAVRRSDVVIGEALNNNKAYTDVFKRLGIEAGAIAKLDIDDRLNAINQALRENVPAAQRASVAAKILGDEAGSAVLTISQGQFARAAKEVKQFGVAVSDVDAETIQRVKDDMGAIGMAFRGILNQVTIMLAPAIEYFAGKLKVASEQTGNFKEDIDNAFSFTLKIVGLVMDAFRGLHVVLTAAKLGFQAWASFTLGIFADVGKGVTWLVNKVNELTGNATNYDFDESVLGILAEQAKMRTQETAKELSDLANQPMPSKNLEEWYAKLKAAQQATSRKAISNVETPEVTVIGGGLTEEQQGRLDALRESLAKEKELENKFHKEQLAAIEEFHAAGALIDGEYNKLKEREGIRHTQALIDINKALLAETEEKRKQREADLEGVRQSLLTEEQLLQEAFEEKMRVIEASRILQLESKMEYDEMERLAEEEHLQKMKDLRESYLNDITKFTKWSYKDQTAHVLGEMVSMTQGVAQHSRKMFEVNKAAGIANAIVNAYTGISKTLSTYPYPINIGMAALHAVSAFSQIQAIRNTSFAGGGGGIAPSAAGSSPATPVTPIGGGGDTGQTTVVKLYGSEGSTFSKKQMRDFLKQIENTTKDGGRVVVV